MIRRRALCLGLISLAVMVSSANQPVLLAPSVLDNVRVRPNPWRSDKHVGVDVTFEQLAPNTVIKIFTVSGHLVKTLPPSGASVTWNRTSDSGDAVASGVYLFLATTADGQHKTGQITLIK